MRGLKEFLRLNDSPGLTGLGGLFGFVSANQAASKHPMHQIPEPSSWLRNVCVTLLSFVIMGLFALIVVQIRPLNPLKETVANFSFTDIYYSMLSTGEAEESHAVVVVDINQFEGRANFAKLLEDIESQHPAAICVDVVFEGVKLDDQDGDMLLADVAGRYDNIIYALKMEDLRDEGGLWVSSFPIHSFFAEFVDVREAFCNMPRGNLYDAMKREIPITARIDTTLYHSMVVETVNLYAHKDITNGRNDAVKINYKPTKFPCLKPAEVVSHRELIEDRIVLVGDLHEQYDQHWTPLGEKMAGVSILAYGIQTLLNQNEVKKPHLVVTFLLGFLVVLLMLYIIRAHARRTKDSHNLVVKYLLGSDYARSIIIFGYSSLLLMVSFLIFVRWNISLSWGWAFSCMAFLGTAGNLYNAIYGYYRANKEKKNVEKY